MKLFEEMNRAEKITVVGNTRTRYCRQSQKTDSSERYAKLLKIENDT